MMQDFKHLNEAGEQFQVEDLPDVVKESSINSYAEGWGMHQTSMPPQDLSLMQHSKQHSM